MKKLSNLLLMFAALAFIFVACEGPMGPDGPKGDKGDQGEQGIQGLPGDTGADGTTTCIQCHDDSQEITAKSLQYKHSGHAMLHNAAYGNRVFGTVYPAGDCAKCHVSQGFLEFQSTGTIVNAPYDDAQQPNCYTCHEIHATYTDDDYALTYGGSHDLLAGGVTFDAGSGNLCANCHQGRAVSPMPVPGGSGVDLTSNRWGMHHSPAANVIAASGLYEITGGSATYPTLKAHDAMDACVTCHMATAYGSEGGGHTMNMIYDVHGTETLNTAGCTSCHGDITAMKANVVTLQAEVETKLETLRALLETAGVYDPANGRNATGMFDDDLAGAYLNWQVINEDKSLGVHNPAYVRAVLDNSIEVLSAMK